MLPSCHRKGGLFVWPCWYCPRLRGYRLIIPDTCSNVCAGGAGGGGFDDDAGASSTCAEAYFMLGQLYEGLAEAAGGFHSGSHAKAQRAREAYLAAAARGSPQAPHFLARLEAKGAKGGGGGSGGSGGGKKGAYSVPSKANRTAAEERAYNQAAAAAVEQRTAGGEEAVFSRMAKALAAKSPLEREQVLSSAPTGPNNDKLRAYVQRELKKQGK